MATKTELKDFLIEAKICLNTDVTAVSGYTQTRQGVLEFDAKSNQFVVTYKNTGSRLLLLEANHLRRLTRSKCPNGRNYVIRFCKPGPGQKDQELYIKELTQADKETIHACVLKLAGAGVTVKQPEGGNKRNYAEAFPGALVTSKVVEPVRSASAKRPVKMEPSSFLSPDNKADSSYKSPAGPRVSHQSQGRSIVQDNVTIRRDSSLNNHTPIHRRAFLSRHILSQYEIPKNASPEKKTAREFMRLDNKENFKAPDGFSSPSASPAANEEKPSNSPQSELTAEAKSQPKHVQAPGDGELPAHYLLPEFWDQVGANPNLRSGESGEWVKGQEEKLTVEGLLCLRDGQWLNADIIDAYLDLICREAPRTNFIPTYAILSFDRKREVPTEWYWALEDNDTVLVPAHLNKNHWATAVVNIPGRHVTLMDSMNNGFKTEDKRDFMTKIMAMLRQVAEQQGADIGSEEEWSLDERIEVPQQKNGIDCGIFALLYAKFAAQQRHFDFGQQHIPHYRRRICYDFIHAIE